MAVKDRSSPVNVGKRQSYTKVKSGNNGLRWSKSKKMERMKKLVDTIFEAATRKGRLSTTEKRSGLGSILNLQT